MPEAYFVKVSPNTTWNNVLNSIEIQVNNARKQLKYVSIVDLYLDETEFEKVTTSISKPHPSYAIWSAYSIPNDSGIWNCITLRSSCDTKTAIVYTAGRTFPLYVSIISAI